MTILKKYRKVLNKEIYENKKDELNPITIFYCYRYVKKLMTV